MSSISNKLTPPPQMRTPVWPRGLPRHHLFGAGTPAVQAKVTEMQTLLREGCSHQDWRIQKLYQEIRGIEGKSWPSPMTRSLFSAPSYDPRVWAHIASFSPESVTPFIDERVEQRAQRAVRENNPEKLAGLLKAGNFASVPLPRLQAAAQQGLQQLAAAAPHPAAPPPQEAPIYRSLTRHPLYDHHIWGIAEQYNPQGVQTLHTGQLSKHLLLAAKEGNGKLLSQVIQSERFEQIPLRKFERALQIAVENDQALSLDLLMKSPLFRKTDARFRESLLSYAISKSKTQTALIFLKNYENIAYRNPYNLPRLDNGWGIRAIELAAEYGQNEILSALLQDDIRRGHYSYYPSDSLDRALRAAAKTGQSAALLTISCVYRFDSRKIDEVCKIATENKHFEAAKHFKEFFRIRGNLHYYENIGDYQSLLDSVTRLIERYDLKVVKNLVNFNLRYLLRLATEQNHERAIQALQTYEKFSSAFY